jgi:hypothetical protein
VGFGLALATPPQEAQEPTARVVSAIVRSSISILATSYKVFYFTLNSAILGTLLAINGFLMIFRFPFFH